MLDSLRGTLARKDADEAVVETAAGLAFVLSVPASTFAALPEPGQPVHLFTHMAFNTQEGEFALYGFATPMEREVFRIFLGISGIGPRKGLMILSQVKIADFAQAIQDRNIAYLSSLKGIGTKTAERLLLELREKMLPYAAGVAGGGSASAAGGAAREGGPALPPGENIADAVAALTTLGCPYSQAARAILRAIEALGSGASREELIREGLRHR
jgi:Holliday junction DNA helicase RuvA